ncbi:ribonuclease E inhibitor RraB [Virgibacillus sp. LDC1]|nr:ribonuclease E inhibitor RraB [Virgibacillus sp. LDC1]
MKYISIMFVLLIILSGCKAEKTNIKSNKPMIIEQYFYSTEEEELKKLADKLITEGYQINDFRSYEHEGKNEWYFYSSKEINEDEINNEDIKSEKYAKEYSVGYDGHGFPIE